MINAPKPSAIRRAKRNATGGGRKRCVKGKSCGAACIFAQKSCLLDLPDPVQTSIGKVRQLVQSQTGKVAPTSPTSQATPTPKPDQKSELATKVRDWVNKTIPPSSFKDEAAKEKFIQDKIREATIAESKKKGLERVGGQEGVRKKQTENLRKEFAPVGGKVKVMSLNGKSDDLGSTAINSGLDRIRSQSKDATAKVDALLEALAKNPVPVIGRDVAVKAEDAQVAGTVSRLTGTATNLAGGGSNKKIIDDIKKYGLDTAGAYAIMDSQVVVMTGNRLKPTEKVSGAGATRYLNEAKNGTPPRWAWGEGAGSTYIHEMGHVMHARAFAGKDQRTIVKETEEAIARLGIKSPTQYGKTNALETFAELYTVYVSNGPQLKKVMPEAYTWMDTQVQNAYNYNP